MPDPPPTPESEGAPGGRSDPGSGLGKKIGPLPLGLWILVGGGILFGVWYFRSHKTASAGTSTDPSATLQSGGAPDITTLQGLGQAMRDLAAQLGATNISPAPPAPSAQGTVNSDPIHTIIREVWNTTHTSGGSDTAAVADSGLPDTSITSRVVTGITSGPSTIYKTIASAPAPSKPSQTFGGFLQRVAAVATGGAIGNYNPTVSKYTPPLVIPSTPFDTAQRAGERATEGAGVPYTGNSGFSS